MSPLYGGPAAGTSGRMRVALLVNRFPVASQTFLQTQFEGLWDADVECLILDKAIDPRFSQQRQPAIDHVHRLSVLSRSTYRAELVLRAAGSQAVHPSLAVRNLRAARHFGNPVAGSHWLTLGRLAGLRPDVLHYSFATYAVGEEHLARALDVPLVISCRGYDLTHIGLDSPDFYSRLWDAANLVHFRSQDLRSIAINRGFRTSTPHRITPPGIDAAFFSPAQEDEDDTQRSGQEPFRILSIGRLVPKKGHEVGLAAIRQLREGGVNVTYDIVGSGESQAALERLAAQYELTAVTRFLGELSPVEVRDNLRRADALLHPSWQEGFGVSVLEAQATELPVVCTDAEGLAENVQDQVTGSVVARGDADSMAEQLARILLDPELSRYMGRAGRARVLEYFTVEREIASYIDSYRSLLA